MNPERAIKILEELAEKSDPYTAGKLYSIADLIKDMDSGIDALMNAIRVPARL